MSAPSLNRRSLIAAAGTLSVDAAIGGALAAPAARRSFRLPNGLSVHLLPNGSGLVAGRVDVNYGAINEEVRGTAHLLEHVIFGNTANFPEGRIRDLSARFRYIRPTVDLQWISCVAEMLPDRLREFLAYTADALFRPVFDADHIRREKLSVLEEIAFRETQSRAVKRMLYGPDHPLMYDYRGTRSSIEGLSASQLKAFHGAGFHPNLMSIILVGDLPAQTQGWIERYFGAAESRPVKRKVPAPVPKLKKRRVIDQKVPHLAPGTTDIELTWNTGVTLMSADVYAVRALNHYLGGGGFYSRLKQELGEKMPVAYAVRSTYAPGMYNSEMVVQATTTTDPERLMDLIFDIFGSMRSEPVPPTLLTAFYDTWRYERLSDARMNHAVRDRIFDETRTGISAQAEEQGYRGVTADDIINAARLYLPTRSGNYLQIFSRGA